MTNLPEFLFSGNYLPFLWMKLIWWPWSTNDWKRAENIHVWYLLPFILSESEELVVCLGIMVALRMIKIIWIYQLKVNIGVVELQSPNWIYLLHEIRWKIFWEELVNFFQINHKNFIQHRNLKLAFEKWNPINILNTICFRIFYIQFKWLGLHSFTSYSWLSLLRPG